MTNAYEAIVELNDHTHWAFGTGFDDPLAGIDTSVPLGTDAAEQCLALGDDALIMSHRLAEWCTNAPELEDEVALANLALDLLGQARLLLSRAAQARGNGETEDTLAYLRAEHEFRNVRLVELPRGDFAHEIARLLVFSTWRLAVFERLVDSPDPVLGAIAAKGVKELTYHREYAASWTVRLGDGTEFSHRQMSAALDALWPYVDELFDPGQVRADFDEAIRDVLDAATLAMPDVPGAARVAGKAGRDGVHTEAMGYLLAEMQSVARAHPGARW
jgi:ring-1,2-phenylacetyl-CoA epoxidase subunit PaaC